MTTLICISYPRTVHWYFQYDGICSYECGYKRELSAKPRLSCGTLSESSDVTVMGNLRAILRTLRLAVRNECWLQGRAIFCTRSERFLHSLYSSLMARCGASWSVSSTYCLQLLWFNGALNALNNAPENPSHNCVSGNSKRKPEPTATGHLTPATGLAVERTCGLKVEYLLPEKGN